MSNPKRDRQRQNREVRRAEEQKQAQRQQLMKRIRLGAIWAVVIIGVFILANVAFGGGDDTALSLLPAS